MGDCTCTHARDEHWTLNTGERMDTRCCYPGCSCKEYAPAPSPTDLPDAETAWAEPLKQWQETWNRPGWPMPGPTKSFLAGFAAASGPWAEQLDAANAEADGQRLAAQILAEETQKARDERDAALARNAELEERLRETNEDADSLDERLTQASRDCLKLRTERNEARELLAGVEDRVARNQPWMPSYVEAMKRLRKATADNLALRAELDNLRDRVTALADEWGPQSDDGEVRMVIDCANAADALRAIVRGSDDEA